MYQMLQPFSGTGRSLISRMSAFISHWLDSNFSSRKLKDASYSSTLSTATAFSASSSANGVFASSWASRATGFKSSCCCFRVSNDSWISSVA